MEWTKNKKSRKNHTRLSLKKSVNQLQLVTDSDLKVLNNFQVADVTGNTDFIQEAEYIYSLNDFGKRNPSINKKYIGQASVSEVGNAECLAKFSGECSAEYLNECPMVKSSTCRASSTCGRKNAVSAVRNDEEAVIFPTDDKDVPILPSVLPSILPPSRVRENLESAPAPKHIEDYFNHLTNINIKKKSEVGHQGGCHGREGGVLTKKRVQIDYDQAGYFHKKLNLRLPLFLTKRMWIRHNYSLKDIEDTLNFYPPSPLWIISLLEDHTIAANVVTVSFATEKDLIYGARAGAVKMVMQNLYEENERIQNKMVSRGNSSTHSSSPITSFTPPKSSIITTSPAFTSSIPSSSISSIIPSTSIPSSSISSIPSSSISSISSLSSSPCLNPQLHQHQWPATGTNLTYRKCQYKPILPVHHVSIKAWDKLMSVFRERDAPFHENVKGESKDKMVICDSISCFSYPALFKWRDILVIPFELVEPNLMVMNRILPISMYSQHFPKPQCLTQEPQRFLINGEAFCSIMESFYFYID